MYLGIRYIKKHKVFYLLKSQSVILINFANKLVIGPWANSSGFDVKKICLISLISWSLAGLEVNQNQMTNVFAKWTGTGTWALPRTNNQIIGPVFKNASCLNVRVANFISFLQFYF